MVRARGDLSRWLTWAVCAGLCAFAAALPTRIAPEGQAPDPVSFIEQRARIGSRNAHATASDSVSADKAEKLDFSLLNSLVVDHPRHAHRAEAGSDDWASYNSVGQGLHGHFASPSDDSSKGSADTSLAELRATASARAGASLGTVGGVPVAHLDRMNQNAVDSTLHLMGLDTPIEDEPLLEGLNPMRVLDQEIPSSAALLQLESRRARNQRKLERAHGADGSMGPVRNAFGGSAHAATVGSAASSEPVVSDSQGKPTSAAAPQDDQVNFLQFHNAADLDAKVHRKRRREQQQQQQQQDAAKRAEAEPFDARAAGAAFALQEQQATTWPDFDHPNSDFKINRRGSPTPQPSHQELHEFLRRSLPAESIGSNFRFRQDPPAAPAGGGAPAGGDAAGGQPGFAYKPSPFKHPPPPPVPPPPPPPPPPNFGPGSEFTGYRFGSTQAGASGSPGSTTTTQPPADPGAAPTTTFASFWEKAYPASSQFSPEGAKEWQRQSAQAAAAHEAHIDAGHDAFNPSFVEVDSSISGTRATKPEPAAASASAPSESEDEVHAAYAQWYHMYNLAQAYPGPAVPPSQPRFQQQQQQQQQQAPTQQPQQAAKPAAAADSAFPSLDDYDAHVNSVLSSAQRS